MSTKILARIIMVAIMSVFFALPASALILPAPGGTIDGIPYALPYDDFWSYSNQILIAIQSERPDLLPEEIYGDYFFATGTGGLDVILYNGPGSSNQNVGPDIVGNPQGDFDFEDAVKAPTGQVTSIEGFWGQDDQLNDGTITGVNGPVTVGNVLDYLHALNPLNNIPVFYMDMNQTGGEEVGQTFTFVGQVMLIDELGDVQHVWAFDNNPQAGDGDFDPDSTITPIAQIPALIGDSGTDYGSIDHNLGSGQADFIAFAPTMDLSIFNPDWLFVTQFNMTNLNDGFEEIFLTGTITAEQPPPPIPEPSTIMLLGAGLLGLGYCTRRRSKK
jgi:hypothetical protein